MIDERGYEYVYVVLVDNEAMGAAPGVCMDVSNVYRKRGLAELSLMTSGFKYDELGDTWWIGNERSAVIERHRLRP